ncbi:hypothetical protein DYB35_011099, partial [Aphanomyces astaci]
VHLSPNASLVLLLWRFKFAIFHRTWLEPGHDTRHHVPTRTTFCLCDDVEFVDGCFTDNHTILLWTSQNTLYSFPAVVCDNVTAQLGQVFVFQPVDDMEVPQSVAYPLARVDVPAVPVLVIPDCQCPRGASLFSSLPGHVTTLTTENHDVIVSFIGPCGCSLLWRSSSSPTAIIVTPLPSSPTLGDNEDDNLTLSHAILDHGTTTSSLMTLSLPDTVPSSRITALAHLSVTRVSKHAAALYESYADSPTAGSSTFHAAKLAKISTLLHKLHHHSLTPRATSTSTTKQATSATAPPASSSSASVPFHPPSPPRNPIQSRVCLVFAGTSSGHVVVSQLQPRVSWTVLRSFRRHSQPITGLYVTPSCQGTTIVASVGADRKVTVYAVHQHHHPDDQTSDGVSVDVVLECVGHADAVVHVEWAFETNHVLVECADRMIYMWSLTTGILERIVPQVMVRQSTYYHQSPTPPSSRRSTHLRHVHVFPCDIEAFAKTTSSVSCLPLSTGSTARIVLNDHVTALLAYLLTWHDDVHIDQLVHDTLGTILVVLPERIPHYKEPSLEALAEFGFHEWEASQMASRLLLHGVIKRLPENVRSTRAAAYMTKFQVELQQMDKRPGGPSHVAIVAAELLAKGLLLFRPHLTDVGQLVLQLIPLTLDDDVAKSRLKQASMRLLVEVGTCEASFVLTVLQQEMNVSDRSIAYREGRTDGRDQITFVITSRLRVLVYLMTWVNLQFRHMVRHLPAVVDTVLTCLDPTKPDRRKKCLAMVRSSASDTKTDMYLILPPDISDSSRQSTKCLHDLVKRFPMVDFHKATQRLAVGTMDGVILLYDLRMVQ